MPGSDPLAEAPQHGRELLRSDDEQRDDGDHDELGERDAEHGRKLAR